MLSIPVAARYIWRKPDDLDLYHVEYKWFVLVWKKKKPVQRFVYCGIEQHADRHWPQDFSFNKKNVFPTFYWKTDR